MKSDCHLVTAGWEDYELLDSGDNLKLERFGEVVTARPETQALWAKQKPELWKQAQASFEFKEKKGEWKIKKALPEPWTLSRGPIKFSARLTDFKHTGVFPEQEPNWVWVKDRVKALGTPNILNLFGYTGIATLVAAQAGAFVTHVDASKQTLDWAHENAKLSGIPEDKIRWMLDDALAFAKRELRRGSKYDGIILDPPAFGRGAKGEVWHIEENLPALLSILKDLLKDTPGSFFLMNGYAAGYSPRSFAQAVESAFGPTDGESGELHIQESGSPHASHSETSGEPTKPVLAKRIIPSGIYVRFVR